MGPKRSGAPVIGGQPASTVKPLQTRNQANQPAKPAPLAESLKNQKVKTMQPAANPQKKPAVTKIVVGSQCQTKKSPQKAVPSKNAKCNQLQKRSFISEQEIQEIISGLQMDRNNNVKASQESLNMLGSPILVNIVKVYSAQQQAFDKLDGKSKDLNFIICTSVS